jgi:predicted PurR-regulated permease PerM
MNSPQSTSPKWSNTTKLMVGLTILAIFAYLFVKFQTLLAPLLLTFILVYLMYSPSNWVSKKLRINWRLSVTLTFLILFLSIVGLITWGGLALLDQGQSLLNFLENIVANLPKTLTTLANTPITFGPFQFDVYHLNLDPIGSQITSSIQPLFGEIGSLLGSIATGAASFVGWLIFIMLMAYFILAETAGKPERILYFDIPGYSEDFRRLFVVLGRTWNAFLRGQILIIAFVIVVYSILFGSLGVRYFFGLAIIAGLARFLPYIGPFIAWSTYALVAYFQGTTIFGFSSLGYAVFIVGTAWLTDLIIDNFVATRVMANVLEVHPAAILVAALIGANLIGITGVILAAPVLATVELVFSYVSRKLFDLDPWEGIDTAPTIKSFFGFQSTMQAFFGRTRTVLSDRLKVRKNHSTAKKD